MFRRYWNGWALEEKLRPADVAAHDHYGWSVGLAGNASIVGAPQADILGQDIVRLCLPHHCR